MVYETPAHASGDSPWRQYRAILRAYLGPQRGSVFLLTASLLGSIALQLVNPQIIGRFLDSAQPGVDQSALALAGLAFIAIGLLQRALTLATVYVGENVSWTATNALRTDLTRHCLRLDMPFHKQHTPGEMIERIDGDADALGNFFSQFVVRLLGNAVLVCGVLVLLFREDWRLGAAMLVYAAITLLALGALQNLAVSRWTADRQAFADLAGYVEERYNGMEDLRSSGAEAYAMDGLYRLLRALSRNGVAARMFDSLSHAGINGLFLMGYALGLALGAYLYTQGLLTIGGAYLVVYYIGMISAPLESMRSEMQDLGAARASLGRVAALLNLGTAIHDSGRDRLGEGQLAVELSQVSFAYDDGAAGQPAGLATAVDGVTGTTPGQAELFAVRDVSFSLPGGRVLGLLGRTGSGKTTLTRLLFRLYDPQAGAIRLGGANICDVPLGDLRSRVGLITQEVQLFHASIRDNLTFFNRRIDDEQIESALRELGLWEWVRSLPAGLDTLLGAEGQGLSAGEAQLLAFARVFLKDPGLVVLDEASSRLDPATEAMLEHAIGRLLHGRTGIVIAHRLHTVQRADDILIMEGGRRQEFGPRAALAADRDSRFAQLLRTGLEEALA